MKLTLNNFRELAGHLINPKNLPAAQILVLTIALFFLSWQTLAPRHFLSGDTGLRFIQIEQLIDNGWRTLVIDYPMRSFDPELAHLPYSGAALVVDGQIFLYLSPFFNIISSFFYKIFGSAGLAVVPTLGGVMTAVALFQLARLVRLPYADLLLWATVIATPILIYSVKLWDHTLATALATWAVYLIIRGLQEQSKSTRYLLGGGVCLGLGLGQRPEMYPFALAAAGSFLLTTGPAFKSGFIVAAGGLLGAIPVWAAQWLWVGHPLGISVGAIFWGYGAKADTGSAGIATATTAVTQSSLRLTKIGNFLLDIQPQDHLAAIATLLILIGALLLVFTIRSQPRRINYLLVGALIVLLTGYSIWLDYSLKDLVKGLLPTYPLYAFALIYPNIHNRWAYDKKSYQFVALTAFFFLTLMLVFWPAFGGFQWGSRYLLPIYPLLLFMGWFAFASYEQFLASKDKKVHITWRFAAVSLLLASIILQVSSVRTLRSYHQQLGEIQAFVTELPADIIITNHYYFPSVMAPLTDKGFLYVTESEDIQKLVVRFAAGGVRQIAIIPGTYFIPEHPPLEIPDRVGNMALIERQPLVYELRLLDD